MLLTIFFDYRHQYRVGPTDFGMGGALYPPIGGGHMGGDKGPMGGDWRVIRDKIGRPLKKA